MEMALLVFTDNVANKNYAKQMVEIKKWYGKLQEVNDYDFSFEDLELSSKDFNDLDEVIDKLKEMVVDSL